jgi:hypothetical protein
LFSSFNFFLFKISHFSISFSTKKPYRVGLVFSEHLTNFLRSFL